MYLLAAARFALLLSFGTDGAARFGPTRAAKWPEATLPLALQEARAPVPATPPDSVPLAIRRQIYADSNLVRVPGLSGRYPRDIVWLAFRYEATQNERQQALDLVGGEVVGGMPLNPGGIYVVRVEHDGTGRPLAEALATLEGLPQVRYANPDVTMLLEPNDPLRSVPAVPLDTVPRWLHDHETSDSPVLSGSFLTNILLVVFREGTPRRERQAAIDAARGTVVGGRGYFGDDGYYVVSSKTITRTCPDRPSWRR